MLERLKKIVKRQSQLIKDYQEEHEILLQEIDFLKKENNMLKESQFLAKYIIMSRKLNELKALKKELDESGKHI